MTRKTRFCDSTVVWAEISTQPLEYLHEPYTTGKQTLWATLLPLIVCVYLLSNFRGGLQKTHDRRRAVRFDPSRSSEVDDFPVIWKGLCDFVLVINSNLSSISHRFWDTTTYQLKIANFPYPPLFNPKFENVSFAPDHWNFAHCERRHSTN